MLDMSDRYGMSIGRTDGLTVAVNEDKRIYNMFKRGAKMDYSELRLPYGWKLLAQELQAMSIAPRLVTKSWEAMQALALTAFNDQHATSSAPRASLWHF